MQKYITISCYVAAILTAFFIAFAPPVHAVSYLRQSTAVTVLVGPFVSAGDGITAETGITPGSQCDLIKAVTKSDLTLTASGGDNDFVHVANGYWSVELTAENTDTLGPLTLTFTDPAVFVPVWKEVVVVPANVYDSMFSTDLLQVDVYQIEGGDATDALATGAGAALTTYDPPTNTEMTAAFSDLADAVWATDKDSPTENSYGWVMNTLIDVLAGRMKIDTAAYTLTFYDYDSDTTPSQVFYLFDSAGAYSTTNVYERDKDALP